MARTGTVGLMPNVNVTSCNHFTLKPAQGHEWIDKSLIMLTARTLAVTRYHLAPGNEPTARRSTGSSAFGSGPIYLFRGHHVT